jgi:hypothetical protein
MPTAAENLRIDSDTDERAQAISDCISQISAERPDIKGEQAQAICIDQANKSMGTRAENK